jgi:hypothetical protein
MPGFDHGLNTDMAASKPSPRFDSALAAWQALIEGLQPIPSPMVQLLVSTWPATRQKMDEMLLQPGMTRSRLADGIEGGLRETPTAWGHEPPDIRQAVMRVWQNAIETHYPAFFEKEQLRINKVLTRGKIRTEAEFYLIRHQIDCLEETRNDPDLLARYMQMIDQFEAR